MMVESRCAITMVVRPLQSSAIASCTYRSDSESSAAVASSSRMMGAFLISAHAMAMRWRWPPESWVPCSPTGVS